MRKEFLALYNEMETTINEILSEYAGIAGYAKVLENTWERIVRLKPLSRKMLNTRDGEIDYFRNVWPAFYGRHFFFLKVHNFEISRAVPGCVETLIGEEEQGIAHFFKINYEFVKYYLSGSQTIDNDFTRAQSLKKTFEELALVIDPDHATVASYRAAWCIAYSEYKEFLHRELERLKNPHLVTKKRKYKWAAGKTAAVEWIQAIVEAKAIEIDGKPATASVLRRDWEELYEESLKDYGMLLYQAELRKGEETPFLTGLINTLGGEAPFIKELAKASTERKKRLKK